jgi:hypothetical protein
MPEPTEYQLLANLRDALQQITVAHGYHFDVASAAVKLDPNCNVESLIAPGGARPFIVLEVKPDSWQFSPANRAEIVLPVTIHWVSDSTPTDDTSRMLTFFRGCADVERAIAVDVGRGGFAKDTQIVQRSYETALDGAQVWAKVDVNLPLRRVYGQPDA